MGARGRRGLILGLRDLSEGFQLLDARKQKRLADAFAREQFEFTKSRYKADDDRLAEALKLQQKKDADLQADEIALSDALIKMGTKKTPYPGPYGATLAKTEIDPRYEILAGAVKSRTPVAGSLKEAMFPTAEKVPTSDLGLYLNDPDKWKKYQQDRSPFRWKPESDEEKPTEDDKVRDRIAGLSRYINENLVKMPKEKWGDPEAEAIVRAQAEREYRGAGSMDALPVPKPEKPPMTPKEAQVASMFIRLAVAQGAMEEPELGSDATASDAYSEAVRNYIYGTPEEKKDASALLTSPTWVAEQF